MRSDFNCRKRALFFGVRSKGTAGSLLARRLSSPTSFGVAPAWYWATWISVLATPMTGVGLAIGLVMVIAKDFLELLGCYQIGETVNHFPILSQD